MPLQKSFSEHHGSSRSKQTWHRAKTHSGVPNTTRPATTKPLRPVSEASKNKLHAFEFRGPAEDVNGGDSPRAKEPVGRDPEEKTAGSTEDGYQAPAERAAITPHGKLVWQELVGVAEEKEEEADNSPNERILWESKRREGVPDISPMLSRRRGKKRARSSSPVSSPSSLSKPATPTVDVKKLTQALKLGHADPALDLWDRFTLSGTANTTPHGAINPALAQIMVSSSPQPVKTLPGGMKAGGTPSGSGLRRAVSCGYDFSKRRKTDRGKYMAQSGLAADDSPSHGTKTFMVNALLNSVNGEINRSKAIQAQQEALRSPSPKKQQRQILRTPAYSSVQRKTTPPPPPPPLFKSPVRAPSESMNTHKPSTPQDESSDYGDDDFDDDALMVLDASTVPKSAETASTTLSPDVRPTLQAEIPELPQASDDDEFGDMDDDVFAAAEDLVAEIDSSHASYMVSSKPADNPVIAQRPASGSHMQGAGTDTYDDDDFGDDFDFEAAEITATQALKQLGNVGGSIPLVRR